MKNIIAVLSIIFVFTACQKQYAPDVRITNGPDTSNLLKRFAIVDISAPTDTIASYSYTYDNLNRCIRAYYFDASANQILITEFSFNGNDSVIASKHTYVENNPLHGYEYFTYDVSGKMIKDSVIEKDVTSGALNFNFSYNYNFAANRIDGLIYNANELFIRSVHLMQYDGSGNIISERDSSFEYAGIPPTEQFDADILHSNTFDNKNCPFYNIYPKYPVILMYENAKMDIIPMYYSNYKNNISSQSITDNSPVPTGFLIYNDRFVYTYNNYPETVVQQDITNNKIYKGFYYY